MKELVWDKTLSVDVEEIDEDHRRLVDLFNILGHAVEDNESADYIEATLEELISCTIWHFRHEERLMLKHGYDGFEEHKSEHQKLIESASELREHFLQEGNQISGERIESLEHWLTGHILGADMELGLYLGRII